MCEYTVKQIADMLGVSKPTVQKVINSKDIEADRVEKNKYRYYSAEKAKEIIKELSPDFDFSVLSKTTANTENETANDRKTTENETANTENTANSTANTANPAITEKLVELLQRELESKNKQIDDLNARLAEAMRAIDQEQQLKALAERKILELEEKTSPAAMVEEAAAGNPEPKKKRFNWFKKD